METKPTEISSSKMYGGYNKRYKHYSPTLGCSMNFHIYFPPPPSNSPKFPVLYWLSGLTCTDENFIAKSGAQRIASSEGIALVAPDTSPRGECRGSNLDSVINMMRHTAFQYSEDTQWAMKPEHGGLNVEGEADNWDFGVGAGFYLNATQEKWKNWRMYDYVVKELPKLLSENFPQLDTSRASIFGHSMGGHGALTIYLKNLDKYKSVSAFAPVVNPINCPWGQKAFTNYLGGNKAEWEGYDATCLITKCNDVRATILIDQLGALRDRRMEFLRLVVGHGWTGFGFGRCSAMGCFLGVTNLGDDAMDGGVSAMEVVFGHGWRC
ncbi:hypothetical protein TEA_014710 [Camellia sinensis var. sinensis]|uniref:S-formylglutathione hydrolase n=1 Tax=Camellia sinensis var. sinensis TaxID=542762 RepID=A0A4S4EDW9_CAMSN|nr:hypothetical protein TEA_014710 [Camellia sinensis var. sinensis]